LTKVATTEQFAPGRRATGPGCEPTEPTGTAQRPAVAAPIRPSRAGRWSSLVALVALSPFVVGAVQILRRGFPPGALFGDRAILALTARDAFSAPVLVGPYSRFYWHHPGPLYFYLLRTWSLVFGQSTVAVVLGATAISTAGAAGILALAYRRGGRPLLIWAALLLAGYLVAIDPIPYDLWNPSVTLLPFVALLLLSWSVACEDWWAMPWLALVASFAVQTHVGLVPATTSAIAFAAGGVWWRRRRAGAAMSEGERRTAARAALTSVAVVVVAWLPPLVQELTSDHGNLSALARFFAQAGSPHSLSDGLTNTGLQATLLLRSVFEPVTLRSDVHQGLTAALMITAVAFVAACVVAWRHQATDTLALLGLVALTLLVGVYAVTRIAGPIQFYLVQWISAGGFVLWLAVGKAAIELVRTRCADGPPSRRMLVVVAVVVLALLAVGTVRAFPGNAGLVNEDLDVPNNRALFGYVPTRQLLAATRPGETVVLRSDSPTAWEVLAADGLLLEQHGRTVRIVKRSETRLLFDDVMLVPRSPGGNVLAFRNRSQPPEGNGAVHIADQGRWSIVRIAGS
jgi:hypothetical protein